MSTFKILKSRASLIPRPVFYILGLADATILVAIGYFLSKISI